MGKKLPDLLLNRLRRALLGEIYPQIRLIAVKFTQSKELLIRYYLDREVTAFDEESIEIVTFEFSCLADETEVTAINTECVFDNRTRKDEDLLDMVIYARRDYDMEDNPVP